MTAPCWLLSVHLLLLHDVTSTRDGNLTHSNTFASHGSYFRLPWRTVY